MIQRYTVHRCDINTHEKSGDVVDVVLYSDVAALEQAVKEKDKIIEAWMLAAEAGTDAHKNYCDQIATLTATIKRTDDIILTLTDDNEKQAERIAALTAELEVERIKQKDWIAGCEICRKGG